MLLPILAVLLTKICIVFLWTMFFSVAYCRTRLTSSELVLFLGAWLVLTTLLAGACGLEFFILILLLIYLSAILILFLFAFLLMPLDKTSVGLAEGLAQTKTILEKPEPLSIALYILTGYIAERLLYLRQYFIKSLASANNLSDASLTTECNEYIHYNWLEASVLSAHTSTITKALRVRNSEELANSMYVENFATISITGVALLLVMLGTLRWLRLATLKG